MDEDIETAKPIKSVTYSYDRRGSRHRYGRDGKFGVEYYEG